MKIAVIEPKATSRSDQLVRALATASGLIPVFVKFHVHVFAAALQDMASLTTSRNNSQGPDTESQEGQQTNIVR